MNICLYLYNIDMYNYIYIEISPQHSSHTLSILCLTRLLELAANKQLSLSPKPSPSPFDPVSFSSSASSSSPLLAAYTSLPPTDRPSHTPGLNREVCEGYGENLLLRSNVLDWVYDRLNSYTLPPSHPVSSTYTTGTLPSLPASADKAQTAPDVVCLWAPLLFKLLQDYTTGGKEQEEQQDRKGNKSSCSVCLDSLQVCLDVLKAHDPDWLRLFLISSSTILPPQELTALSQALTTHLTPLVDLFSSHSSSSSSTPNSNNNPNRSSSSSSSSSFGQPESGLEVKKKRSESKSPVSGQGQDEKQRRELLARAAVIVLSSCFLSRLERMFMALTAPGHPHHMHTHTSFLHLFLLFSLSLSLSLCVCVFWHITLYIQVNNVTCLYLYGLSAIYIYICTF